MERLRRLAEELLTRDGCQDCATGTPGLAEAGVGFSALRRPGCGTEQRRDAAAALSHDKAVSLMLDRYLLRPHLNLLPAALQPVVFDMYVHSGAVAVKLLQRLLMAEGADLIDDGKIGARTLAAVRAAAERQGVDSLAHAYALARRDYAYALAEARPSSRKYVRRRDGGKAGWILRAEEFLPETLWLSDAEHRARTAHWI
jgi:lysozyme family protein